MLTKGTRLLNAVKKIYKTITGKDSKSNDVTTVVEGIANSYTDEGGGTTVVANPTLAGTETTLTGLEVDGTKYAVPQGGGSTESVLLELSDTLPDISLDDDTVETFELTTDPTDLANNKIHISQESLNTLLNIDYTKYLCIKFSNIEGYCFHLQQYANSPEETSLDYIASLVGIARNDIYDQSMYLSIIKGTGVELTIKNMHYSTSSNA